MVANQPHKAIESLSKAIDQDPDDADAFRLRADAYLSTGKHAEAINDFEHVLPQAEKDSNLLNNFAWVLATSPDDKLRDGERAVKLATEACELTGYETPHILSTLAAAYAESGDFENAKKWSAKGSGTISERGRRGQVGRGRELACRPTTSSSRKSSPVTRKANRSVNGKRSKTPSCRPRSTDHAASPSALPAPARTADF